MKAEERQVTVTYDTTTLLLLFIAPAAGTRTRLISVSTSAKVAIFPVFLLMMSAALKAQSPRLLHQAFLLGSCGIASQQRGTAPSRHPT